VKWHSYQPNSAGPEQSLFSPSMRKAGRTPSGLYRCMVATSLYLYYFRPVLFNASCVAEQHDDALGSPCFASAIQSYVRACGKSSWAIVNVSGSRRALLSIRGPHKTVLGDGYGCEPAKAVVRIPVSSKYPPYDHFVVQVLMMHHAGNWPE